MTAHPPCPFCGERQSKDEAIPSRPILGARVGNEPRTTYYHDHCRACGERIVWGFMFGDGSMRDFGSNKPAVYS